MRLATNSYVPLFAALLIVAHTLFLKSGESSSVAYAHSFIVALITSLPLFLTVYIGQNFKGLKQALIWSMGFIAYPLVATYIYKFEGVTHKFAFSVDEFLIFILLYLFANIHPLWQGAFFSKASERFKSNVTLSHVIIAALVTLSFVSAFIFSSDPVISDMTENKVTINVDTAIISITLFFQLLIQFLAVSALIWAVYYLTSRVLVNEILSKFGVYTFLCTVTICLIVVTPLIYSILFLLPVSSNELLLFVGDRGDIFHKTNYQTVLLAFAIFTPLVLLFEKHQKEQQFQQLAEEKNTSELKLLQQQVNPHFLFNTLNNIYAHSLSGSDKTPKLISRLSNMLRYTVYDGQKNKVSLSEEIQYLNDFIALQTLRAKDNLHLKVIWPEEVDESLSISPLLLIIIIENAFKHSIERTTQDCSIVFELKIENNRLTLCCENTLVENEKSKLDKGGLGLENLKRRLDLVYPQYHKLTYGNQGTNWRVELSIELAK